MFIVAVLVIAPNWKQPKCPSVGERPAVIQAHPEVQFSNEKEQLE
jgi:hypothetical protein